MRAAILVVAALCACSACNVNSFLQPQPSSVLLSVNATRSLAVTEQLRYAVVFTYANEFAVSSDSPVAATDLVEVPLVTPAGDWEHLVTPLETALLPSRTGLDIYRPRFVVYQDGDASGTLTAGAIDAGLDRIMGIDSSSSAPSVAAIPSLDKVLSKMTLEETEAYYEATGGAYTPFVHVQTTSGYVELVDSADATPIRIDLSDSPIPAERFSCGRNAVYLYGDPVTPATDLHAYIDAGIAPAEVCGATIAACTGTDLSTLASPDVTESDAQANRRIVQCRANGAFDVLVIQTATMTCEDCTCSYVTSADAYFARTGATPTWWPCGSGVNYCDSNVPLYHIDAKCLP